MRVLVYPATTEIGGSQINAIELADEMQRLGHEVVVFGPEGPLCEVIDKAGLPFVAAPRPRLRPSPAVMRALVRSVDEHRIQIVHGYEWPPIVEAVYGPFVRRGTPVTGTVMSMGIAPFIPNALPLVAGTEEIVQLERPRRPSIQLIEPPVDTIANAPATDTSPGRRQLGVDADEILVVVVSRLALELKREGLLEAIRAAGALAAELPIRLAIVGDGPTRDEIESAAAQANAQAGRDVVTLTGAMLDPRALYAAADVTLGMGSSALRAMAFAKPLVVQGERGFWELLTEDSLPTFLHHGWYGLGPGDDGTPRLIGILRDLAAAPEQRRMLGDFARRVVEQRFSLARAGKIQEEIYQRTLRTAPNRTHALPSLVRPFAQVMAYNVKRRYQAKRGKAAADDFNALTAQSVATTNRGGNTT